VKRIRVIVPENHTITDDTTECVAILNKAGVGAHEGQQEQAFGIIWIHEDDDFDRGLTMLRALNLPVVEESRAHATYDKSK
jgi:hypothetical protein